MSSRLAMTRELMDLDEIRRLTITALFSDDILADQIVLKGGNALSLAYRLGTRSSLDLDFSMESDFADFEEAKTRLIRALSDRFSSVGLEVFDIDFQARPLTPGEGDAKRWGGYQLVFKLIESAKRTQIGPDLDAVRRQALVAGPEQQRKFTVDLSKFEYCAGKRRLILDDCEIYVYSPPMLAVEKLRAICQQTPEYKLTKSPRPRARDFYDIHLLISEGGVDLAFSDTRELVLAIFRVKDVPLDLIGKIPRYREFHRPDWPSVQSSVRGLLADFDYYFDFVVERTTPLKALWIK